MKKEEIRNLEGGFSIFALAHFIRHTAVDREKQCTLKLKSMFVSTLYYLMCSGRLIKNVTMMSA